MVILLLIAGLLMFVGLVVVHEFGHFVMARRNGVEVEEFGIGFPPRLYKKRMKGGYDFTINLLPLGGFVRLKGEHDADKTKGSFGAAPLVAKIKIMAAGVVMNLVTAFVLLTILAAIGMPKIITKDNPLINEDQYTVASDEHIVKRDVLIQEVEEGSPAEKAGLQPLDTIISLGPTADQQEQVSLQDKLPSITQKYAGQTVVVKIIHKNTPKDVTVTLRTQAEIDASRIKSGQNKGKATKGYLGVGPGQYEVVRYTWSSPVVAAGVGTQVTRLTFRGLGMALKGFGSYLAGIATNNHEARDNGSDDATEQVSGPIGIFFVLKAGASQGLGMTLFIIALISLTLAIMNILPIPALDGGRLFVTLLFRAMRHPLRRRTEELIHGTGFMLLMMLFLLITVVDIHRFF